jgi:hypothetical protein
MPWRALQIIFLTLLGIISFHTIFQTGLVAEIPGREKRAALGPN